MQPDASAPLLSVTDLDVQVGGRSLIQNLSFKVSAGDLVEIRGENGVGKTTLLRYLAGIRRLSTGRIDYPDESLVYLSQKTGGSPSLTALEHLRWLTRIANEKVDDARLLPALERLGLQKLKDKPLGTLSAGQTRRCTLASLLVLDVKLWLLDEPLTSLDEDAGEWLRDAITTHRAQNGAALVATHSSLSLPNTTSLNLQAE